MSSLLPAPHGAWLDNHQVISGFSKKDIQHLSTCERQSEMLLTRYSGASPRLRFSAHCKNDNARNGRQWQLKTSTLVPAKQSATSSRKCINHALAAEERVGECEKQCAGNNETADMGTVSGVKGGAADDDDDATLGGTRGDDLVLPNINAPMVGVVLTGARLSNNEGKSRRQALLAGGLLPALLFLFPAANNATVAPAKIDLTKAPTHPFDAADGRLREAATLFQRALSAPTVEEEEKLWTEVIDKYGKLDAEWVPDIVSRAWGNRGNSRSRQGKMEQALEDFDHSIELAPYAADPVLNRGVTLESLGRYDEAAADYQAVLAAQPNDPAAWNNLGNVKAALRQWDEALLNYRQAVQLAPEFSFAAANYALALYQVGKENEAFKQFRSLLRKYPEFPDVRAALAVALYAQGLTAEAETNWGRMEDGRYRDRNWVRYTRKWPPRLVNALEGFLDVKAVAAS